MFHPRHYVVCLVYMYNCHTATLYTNPQEKSDNWLTIDIGCRLTFAVLYPQHLLLNNRHWQPIFHSDLEETLWNGGSSINDVYRGDQYCIGLNGAKVRSTAFLLTFLVTRYQKTSRESWRLDLFLVRIYRLIIRPRLHLGNWILHTCIYMYWQ